jgi:four helix bundle protein
MRIQSFRDLEAWKLAVTFVVDIYDMSARFPREERYGLTAQLRRRAAVSVPSKLAEGHQLGTRSYRRSIRISLGSLVEVETQIELGRRLGFVSDDTVTAVLAAAVELRRVLHGLDRSLKRFESRDQGLRD